MHKVWKLIYSVGVVPCIVVGYRSLLLKVETNADWIFVTITFVTMSLFPLAAIGYGSLRGVKRFRRPSLDRSPFAWWEDTLQSIRVSWVSMALFWLGSCLALLKTDRQGVMLYWFYTAMTIGLFIGIFREIHG